MKNLLSFCKAPQINGPAITARRFIFVLVLIFSSPVVFAQDNVVTGKVIDYSNKAPLVGVTIFVENSSIGTTTDKNGKFSLRVPPNVKLVFSNTGYDSKTIPATSMSGELVITLVPNVQALDDIVVIGYGTTRKRDLTGSVGTIRTEKLEKEKPLSVQDLLRSSVPGMNVSFTNSAKGGGDIIVRGRRSLTANNNPLIVVDNVIFFGELSEINPMDIEQIDVLKDASAAATYGAKSANGVILIITKKGKSEKPSVRFDAGLSAVTLGPKNRKVYGPEGYLRYRSDLFASNERYKNPGKFERPTDENLQNAGITLAQWRAYTTTTGTDDDIWLQRINLYDYERQNFAAGKTFDWYDEAFRTGLNQDYNITLSGKKEKVSYYWSAGKLNSQGIIAGDNYNTYRSNLKLDAGVTKFLDVGINLNFQNRTDGNLAIDKDGNMSDWPKEILNNSPYAQPRDNNGDLIVNPMGTGLNRGFNQAFDNQYRKLEKGYTTINSIGYAKVKLPFNITYTLNYSPRFQQFHNRYHESSQHPDWRSTHNGYVVRENTKKYDWQIDNIINWEQKFGGLHDVKLTLLQNAEEHRSWNEKIEARDFSPSDVLGFNYLTAANLSKSTITSTDEHSTGDALMARLFYGFDNRYMTTLTVRRDGYSAFGLSNPRATFYSASFAWSFYNEKFINWDALSAGKLRVSWGKNGNRDIGIYTALSNLTTGSGKYPYVTSAGAVAELSQLFVDRMANPALKWESTSAYNAILDFGFFKNRVTASVEVYDMPTTDLIMEQTLVDITGFTKITSNLGEVVNKGLEITLNTANIQSNNFTWNTSLGLSMNRNRIKHLYYVYEDVLDASGKVVGSKEQDVIANGWFIDKDINTIWNYKTAGIWQEDERAAAALYGLIPGDVKIKDNHNPDARRYTNEDKEFQGSRNPQYRFFVRNEFSFMRDLTASVNLYGHLGHKQETYEYMNNDGFMTDRTNYYVREYWTPGAPSDKYARLNSTNPQNAGPPLVLSKSFVRLESISLSYRLPARMVKSIAAQQVRLYGGVRNVALWTKEWDYWDPEVNGPNPKKNPDLNGPSPRTFTLGASVTF